jgi:glycosyltransferase involved in cell wall biosynthesis
MRTYSVVHISTAGDFLAPLVASQLFDHAEVQATLTGLDRPIHVSAWLFEPMRRHIELRARRTLRDLRQRCPHVDVRVVGGIGRWDDWPALQTARLLRRRLGAAPVVYHCRGESSAEWAGKLRRHFPQDAIVLDVRGALPYELLLAKAVTRLEDAVGEARADFDAALAKLRRCIAEADGVTTVSANLRRWLIDEAAAPAETALVPCCVKTTVDDGRREAIRRTWGVTTEKIYVYLGTTTSPSQGLEDLVLPFLKASQQVAPDVRVLLLTPDLEAMGGLAAAATLDPVRTTIMCVPQSEVRHVLTAADLGLLLRPPLYMNRWSQPTKLGEYLASGLPVVVEQGTGDVPEMLQRSGAGLTVHVGGAGAQLHEEARRVHSWVQKHGSSARQSARVLAERELLWKTVSPVVRALYHRALERRTHFLEGSTIGEDTHRMTQRITSKASASARPMVTPRSLAHPSRNSGSE